MIIIADSPGKESHGHFVWYFLSNCLEIFHKICSSFVTYLKYIQGIYLSQEIRRINVFDIDVLLFC